jgi:hypothetical protein
MSEQLWRCGDEELLAELSRAEGALRRSYGRVLELVGEVEGRKLGAAKGYRSSAQMLQDVLRISRAEARRRLAHAEAVTAVRTVSGAELPAPLPATAQALRDGVLGDEHVESIRRTLTALPPSATPAERESAERILVDAAHTLDPSAITRLGQHILAHLDQDGAPPTDAELLHPANELRLTPKSGGRLAFNGELDAEGAALFTTVLSPLSAPRPATDGQLDPRTRAERQGDALVDALRLAASSADLPTEAGERPTVVVTMTLESLREQVGAALLDGPGWIDARAARRLACDSNAIPVVLGGRGEPLDVGRRSRTVPAALRRALVARDGGCAFPGCGASAKWCDAHHVIHWVDGGATALDNLALLCGFHHRLLHHTGWDAAIVGGRPEFYPPPFVDPQRRPRRNPLHGTWARIRS